MSTNQYDTAIALLEDEVAQQAQDLEAKDALIIELTSSIRAYQANGTTKNQHSMFDAVR